MSTEAHTAVARTVSSPERSGPLTVVLWVLAAIGGVTFLIGVGGEDSQRAWQAYLVNWLFWAGLALSGLTFSAILQATNAQWAGSLRQLAESLAAFLPISFFLFIVLFIGSEQLFSWIQDPVSAKEAWLNKPFLILRNLFALIALYSCGFVLLRASLRARGIVAAQGTGGLPGVFTLLFSGTQSTDREDATKRLTIVSPIFILLYAIVFSLFAFDLVMSLEPHWISTLFGAYFCIGNLYAGLSLLAVLAVLTRSSLPPAAYSPGHAHDLGKLIFGFCILWTYMFWCHYLPIWYGNLPEETGFLVVRLLDEPWTGVSFIVLVCNFLLPFPVLLLQWVKRAPAMLAGISAIILIGMWLERYILVVPSIWHEHTLPLGWIELGILLGFFALFVLAFRSFVKTFPLAPPTSPLS